MEVRKLAKRHGASIQGRREKIQWKTGLEANNGTRRNNWGGRREGRLEVRL